MNEREIEQMEVDLLKKRAKKRCDENNTYRNIHRDDYGRNRKKYYDMEWYKYCMQFEG